MVKWLILLNLSINKKDIIYDGKVKMNKGNKGVILINDKSFNNFTYVIFSPSFVKIVEAV